MAKVTGHLWTYEELVEMIDRGGSQAAEGGVMRRAIRWAADRPSLSPTGLVVFLVVV
jgi:hypothetical protein